MRKSVLIICLCQALSACMAVPSVSSRIDGAYAVARAGGLQPFVTASPMPLQAFRRDGRQGQPLQVFIEGDGFAWVTPSQPSMDPTPIHPVALELAAATEGRVLYLGRPGQYLRGMTPLAYWTDARFAERVIDSYVVAIRDALARRPASGVHLIGYSGGAAVAALVAERARDELSIVSLTTIAGNLDTAVWAHEKKLAPLANSLNPAEQARQLATLPQRHLVGDLDEQVPAQVQASWLKHLGSGRCVEVLHFALAHAGPWLEPWKQAGGTAPACRP